MPRQPANVYRLEPTKMQARAFAEIAKNRGVVKIERSQVKTMSKTARGTIETLGAECGTICRGNRCDQARCACLHCGHMENADFNANVPQVRVLAVEPPARTLRRGGKKKQLRATINVAVLQVVC